MGIGSLLNIKSFKNKDLFDIRSFIIVFSIYSIISIWSADSVYKKAIIIKDLKDEVKLLKSEYVYKKTILMTRSRRSYLLKKAETFGFSQSMKPLTTIYLEDEY